MNVYEAVNYLSEYRSDDDETVERCITRIAETLRPYEIEERMLRPGSPLPRLINGVRALVRRAAFEPVESEGIMWSLVSIATMTFDKPGVRCAIAEALGGVTEISGAVEILNWLKSDTNPAVRNAALESLEGVAV